MGLDGKIGGESVDKWGYLCYIGTRWDEYPIKVKDMILKEALAEKRRRKSDIAQAVLPGIPGSTVKL